MGQAHDNTLFNITQRLEAQYYDTTHEWLRSLLLKKRNEAIAIATVNAIPALGTRVRS